jgi:antitoxin ParD1/3/4
MAQRFPPDLQTYVDEMIANGNYETVHDLVVDAVYLHRDAELNRRRKYEGLKKEIALGIEDIDKGRVAPLDMDDVMRRARREVAKLKKKANKRSVK